MCTVESGHGAIPFEGSSHTEQGMQPVAIREEGGEAVAEATSAVPQYKPSRGQLLKRIHSDHGPHSDTSDSEEDDFTRELRMQDPTYGKGEPHKRRHTDQRSQSDQSESNDTSPKKVMRINLVTNLEEEEEVQDEESDDELALRDFIKDGLTSNEDFQAAASRLKQFNGDELTLDDLDDWLDGGGTDYSEWQIMLLRSYEYATEEIKPTTGPAEHDPTSSEDQEVSDDDSDMPSPHPAHAHTAWHPGGNRGSLAEWIQMLQHSNEQSEDDWQLQQASTRSSIPHSAAPITKAPTYVKVSAYEKRIRGEGKESVAKKANTAKEHEITTEHIHAGGVSSGSKQNLLLKIGGGGGETEEAEVPMSDRGSETGEPIGVHSLHSTPVKTKATNDGSHNDITAPAKQRKVSIATGRNQEDEVSDDERRNDQDSVHTPSDYDVQEENKEDKKTTFETNEHTWTIANSGGNMLVNIINLTAISTSGHNLLEMDSHCNAFQEHSAKPQALEAWKQKAKKRDCTLIGGPIDPKCTHHTGGVGIMCKDPLALVPLEGASDAYNEAFRTGRLIGTWLKGPEVSILNFSIYGWTDGEHDLEALQKTDDLVAIAEEECRRFPGAYCMISGDFNAHEDTIPSVRQMTTDYGWTDLGAKAEIWGGINRQHTCKAGPDAKASRIDFVLVNECLFPAIRGFQVDYCNMFKTHQPMQVRIDAGQLKEETMRYRKTSSASTMIDLLFLATFGFGGFVILGIGFGFTLFSKFNVGPIIL